MNTVLILNGPNINFLGKRNPEIYGTKTLQEINDAISDKAKSLNVEVVFFQSNSEGDLIDCIQNHWGDINGIVINPGALTHYGYSLKDALLDSSVPVIEVHLSNIHSREEWRKSIISDIVSGQIAGFGWRSYIAALDVMSELLDAKE
ncbi:MAG: type II 3-dehydroquinate dehydratase [Chloroflexota bacterium]|nr:type II 3-dehydroquinate dehydratase [Chloroflexota bacterium]